MASQLRSKLKAMGIAAPAPQRPPRGGGGLLRRVSRLDIEPGLLTLSGTGLRRIGWSGRAFDVRRCLFLDTETTGLSGGAGTVALLVGAGHVSGDAFVIEQFLMRDYADEPELIAQLADMMEGFDCVCTFNGKNFDMPLLEARFTMCRLRHRWRELEDLDLLHPARRTWKLRLGSCRLARIEENILGIERVGDLPGSEVPQRWFSFLKSGDMSLLEDIIDHNRQDIATLATLLVRLCAIYASPEQITEKRDLFSVGKALERQGELGKAVEVYRISAIPTPAGTLEGLRGDRVAGLANWHIYLISRRSGKTDEMERVLLQMLKRGQMKQRVCVELAKLYEHRRGDVPRALRYAQQALDGCIDQEERDAVNRRIGRLNRKLLTAAVKNGGNNNGIL